MHTVGIPTVILCAVQCTVYTVYSVQCAVYSVQCTVCSVQDIRHQIYIVNHTKKSLTLAAHIDKYSDITQWHYYLYNVQCTLYTVHALYLYNVQLQSYYFPQEV